MTSKHFKHLFVFVLAGLVACKGNKPTEAKTDSAITQKATTALSDTVQIQSLIRNMLNWAEVKKCGCDLTPAIEKDSVYIGFDTEKLKTTIKQLDSTNFFSPGFIDNYRQIILTLDKKLRCGELHKWQVGELPTFSFANDVDPWCLCQDVPYDKPSPWDWVVVKVVKLEKDKGDFVWKWGKPELNGADWNKMSYKFSAEKINGQWRISYLQGFDYKQSVQKDGDY